MIPREDYIQCVKNWITNMVVVKQGMDFYDDHFKSEEDKVMFYVEYLHRETFAIIQTIKGKKYLEKDFNERMKNKGYNTFIV